jgi:ribosome maturation factor RimP
VDNFDLWKKKPIFVPFFQKDKAVRERNSLFSFLRPMTEQQAAAVIEKLIGETNPDVFVVEIRLHRGKRNVLSVLVDTDRGIRIEECAQLSRVIGAHFDVDPQVDFPYVLEVSSPGLDQPLRIHRQYVKNTGRKLKVLTLAGEVISGKLVTVTDSGVQLELEPKGNKKEREALGIQTIDIPFENIKTAKVLVSFN